MSHYFFYYARCKMLQIHVVYATTLSAILKTRRLCLICGLYTTEMRSQDVLSLTTDQIYISLTERVRRNLMSCLLRSETDFRRSIVFLDPGGFVSLAIPAVQHSAFPNLLLSPVSHHS